MVKDSFFLLSRWISDTRYTAREERGLVRIGRKSMADMLRQVAMKSLSGKVKRSMGEAATHKSIG